jgi:hypothetical protein
VELNSQSLEAEFQPAFPERRRVPRQLVSFAYIELDENNAGVVLNITERGLAVQALVSLLIEDRPKIRFQFLHSSTWVETKTRIAWSTESTKVAGLEFVDLSPGGRSQIRAWLSSVSSLQLQEKGRGRHPAGEGKQGTTVTLESESEPLVLETVDDSVIKDTRKNLIPFVKEAADLPESETTGPGAHSRISTPIFSEIYRGPEKRSKMRIFAALAALSAVASFAMWTMKPSQVHEVYEKLRGVVAGKGSPEGGISSLPNSQSHSQDAQTSPTLPLQGVPAAAVVSGETPAASLAPSSQPPEIPRFAVQVAALTLKEDADAFADSLHQKNFPAFVFRHRTDRLYKVIIGPYDNSDSAIRIQHELAENGFEAIRISWNPAE